MGQPRPLFLFIFVFSQILQFLQQINVKKCPSSIRCWDSNSQPSENKSPPLTTRPGLPPGCGSVGTAVTSNCKGPKFKSSHWQKIILNVYCQLYWKEENKEKETRIGPLKKITDKADLITGFRYLHWLLCRLSVILTISKHLYPKILKQKMHFSDGDEVRNLSEDIPPKWS